MNKQEKSDTIHQQRDMMYIFLGEMEAIHRAIRQLHDGGFLDSPTPEEAKTFAESALDTMIRYGYVLDKEGNKVYGSPATVESINTIIMQAPLRNITRNKLSAMTKEEILSVAYARTEDSMPESILEIEKHEAATAAGCLEHIAPVEESTADEDTCVCGHPKCRIRRIQARN